MSSTFNLHASDTLPCNKTDPFIWKSPDGLTLAGLEWRPEKTEKNGDKIAVLCLPGFSRNTRDFNHIASFLRRKGHHVFALDYRGRGKSDWDPDWQNYTLPVEQTDIATAIEKLGLKRFAVLGTSRGGLHALLMSLSYPADRMAAVIFNDIGPEIEVSALQRIATSLNRPMTYRTYEEVSKGLQCNLGSQFPDFHEKNWLKLAGQLASENGDGVEFDYDPALARQFDGIDENTPVPDLWQLYENLSDRPVLILRGEHSDILNVETSQKMLNGHPLAELRTIPAQGHAPVLWEPETHAAIATFLAAV